MKSPQPPNQNTLLPPASDEVEVLNQVNSHSDTISQKFQASGGERVSLSSQLGPQDIGIPTTPEQHAVRPINEAAFDQGYDSEGLQAPWEEAKELEKLLQSESGGMAVDPEEMQQMIAEHRNKGKPKPPSFMHFMMPLKTF